MQLRAPKIMTMGGPSLDDHCIGVSDDRIAYLLPIAEAPFDPDTIDLPHTTLLPGFVNAHCHLDLSHLCGKVSYTGSFTEWIQKIVTLRQHEGDVEIRAAAQALIRSGVTSVMDHVGEDPAIADLMGNALRKWMFFEVIGFTPEQSTAALKYQTERAMEARRQGVFASPSPHAPYSLDPEVFEQIIQSSCRLKAGMTEYLSIHCAEGIEEWEMFTGGRGKMWDLVRGLIHTSHPEPSTVRHLGHSTVRHPEAKPKDLIHEILRAAQDDRRSPIHYLSKNNLLPRTPWLAVHCNTLTDDDIVSLKHSHATVVHCPRSHRYFSHPPFPMERLRAAGVPVAIGTDSLASCPNFDFLEELRALREEFSFLTTDEILQMATFCHPGMTNGAFADIIGLPQQNDLLSGPITFSMIGGRRVI